MAAGGTRKGLPATGRRRFALGSAAALAALGSGAGRPAGAAAFEFKAASNLPVDHPVCVRATQMFAAIERESGGRMRTRFYPNSLLGGDAAMFEQLRLGVLNFFVMTPAVLASLVPVAEISYVGFAYKDAGEALRVFDGPLGEYVRAQTAAKGLYLLRTIWSSGMIQIGSNSHPIRTREDLRGFKLRISGGRTTVDLFKAFGASAITMNFNEVYTALQTRLLDGEAAPLALIDTARLFEVNKYVTITNHAWGGLWVAANGDTWQRLPPDLQAIVERNDRTYGLLERRDSALYEASVADKLARRGIAFNRVDQEPFRAGLQPYYKSWADAFGATAWSLLETSLGRKLA